MTREEIRNDILGLKSNYILAELPTSVGKSRAALEFINEKKIKGTILIVVPRLVLFDNWKDEFVKWGYDNYLQQVVFTTYVSLPKHIHEQYDIVIFDECHHLSERAREAAEYLKSNFYLLLSATVTRAHRKELKLLFPKLECYKITMREAIAENILPDPKVYLVPLYLDKENVTESFLVNPKAKGQCFDIPFSDRFKAKQKKDTKYKVHCTQTQYYQEMSSMIEYYKKTYFRTNSQIIYFRWQHKAKERLMWLSGLKNKVALEILDKFKDKRTLTFCNGIEQTKQLGQYCINSENDNAEAYLRDFNKGKINHITACNMLSEGVNLTNCQVGIFVSINSSEIMTTQKNGRLLRHSEPIIFIIYYKDTREEELVNEIIKNYNPELITVVKNLEQLNEY